MHIRNCILCSYTYCVHSTVHFKITVTAYPCALTYCVLSTFSTSSHTADMIQVGTSPLSDLAFKAMGIPPESPEFQVVRLEVSDAYRSINIRHSNPMARMGGVVYGVAKFTAYGHTGSFSKQQGLREYYVFLMRYCSKGVSVVRTPL